MVASRRAAIRGASPALVAGVRAALTVIGVALAGVLSALGVSSVHMARRVVTPAGASPTRASSRSTRRRRRSRSTRTPDTRLPAVTASSRGHRALIKLGSVLGRGRDDGQAKLLTHIAVDARCRPTRRSAAGTTTAPDELHLPFTPELIGSAVGPCPAWLFPAGERRRRVIQVQAAVRPAPSACGRCRVFHALGITTLVVSYRNDGEAPRSRAGTYALGATEWRDIDAAVGFARRRGARRRDHGLVDGRRDRPAGRPQLRTP